MTEEQITKKILEWLLEKNWEIVSFDFPQSGTGVFLHPNKEIRSEKTKNEKAFIPDIVAVKENTALFFENKNRFFLDDFKKLKKIKLTNFYSQSIDKLLSKYQIENIYYGIGMINKEIEVIKAKNYYDNVDFIVLVDKSITIEKDGCNLF